MSSTPSLPFSIIATPRDHRIRVLKFHIIVHILVFSTVVLLLMQLISHTTTLVGVGDSGLPPLWMEMFVRQLVDGTEMFIWVAVYLLVLLDGLHALLCIGWYADQLTPFRRRRNVGRRRMATKTWFDSIRQSLEEWRQQCLKPFETRDGEENSRRPIHDMEWRSAASQNAPQDRKSSHWMVNSDITPSPLSSPSPHTYHPFLHPTFTSVTRHILLALWDTIMLLTLTSHIYIYAANIRPGLAFCSKHDYPLWHSKVDLFTLPQRCARVNWNIHSAGGCSATGAVALALWHFCALVGRLWDVVDEKLQKLRDRTQRRVESELHVRRKGIDEVEVEVDKKKFGDLDREGRCTKASIHCEPGGNGNWTRAEKKVGEGKKEWYE
ncbi:hypothetical protein G6011_03073 [Alternaria panax]|uniref:Uncharacterized protein n=1 Tax=Alternaria panax TaxID=48097 RepID=A0AAD4IE66_9PLEO|nr:hypothetical protein G6011_03073 [Alternaria panax]